MILPLLLSLAATAPPLQNPSPVTQGTGGGLGQTRRQNYESKLLRRGQALSGAGNGFSTLGGNFTVGGLGPISNASRTHVPGVWQLQLDDPGTGWQESVLLGVPSIRQHRNPPLLVMFHGFSVSEWDCYLNSPIFQDALNRGWYVIAPLGAHDVNFGIDYAQVNIEYALDLFTTILPVDPDRIYGLGFSMGGGAMMSYGARHLDPAHPRFAAMVNHTGGVSIANTYWNSSNTFIFDHKMMFGGSPADLSFRYSRASVVDIDEVTNLVDPLTDQARNLAHIPILNEYAQGDPLLYLINQTQVVHTWMQLIPGMETFLLTPNQNEHSWDTIDSNTALNYLYSKTLETPTDGEHRVLADREATWFHFYIYQDTAGEFTPFRWNLNSATNRLTIDQTENLAHVVVNTLTLGLNTAVNAEVVLETTDGSSEQVTLMGYNIAPQQVLRNGLVDTSWTWDANSKSVTIVESDPASAPVWKIRP